MALAKRQKSNIVPASTTNIVQVPSLSDIDLFNQFCREYPNAVPQYVIQTEEEIQYVVGFWWLALEQGQKKKALEDNPVFAEKYTYETCMNYCSIIRKIPTSSRDEVACFIPMGTTKVISGAFDKEQDLIDWFNFALRCRPTSALMSEIVSLVNKAEEFYGTRYKSNLLEGVAKLDDTTMKKGLKEAVETARLETDRQVAENKQYKQRCMQAEKNIAHMEVELQSIPLLKTENQQQRIEIDALVRKSNNFVLRNRKNLCCTSNTAILS